MRKDIGMRVLEDHMAEHVLLVAWQHMTLNIARCKMIIGSERERVRMKGWGRGKGKRREIVRGRGMRCVWVKSKEKGGLLTYM